MHSTDLLPYLLIAQADSTGVWSGLSTYGPLGLWVLWMIYRDNREAKIREDEAKLQQQRHEENLTAMKRMESAMRTNTDSMIAGIAGLRSMDGAFQNLLSQMKEQNRPSL
jgi:hypothetical protein